MTQHPGVNIDAYAWGMHVHERRRSRLLELLREIPAAELSRRSGIAASTISRYKQEPGSDGAKNISEENARRLEGAGGKPEYWLDKQTAAAGSGDPTRWVAHELSPPWPSDVLPRLTWESLMQNNGARLFVLELRDDALEPAHHQGALIVWSQDRPLKTGRLVIIRDEHGQLHTRLLAETSTPNKWQAVALRPGFRPFDIPSKTATVLAVHKGFLEED